MTTNTTTKNTKTNTTERKENTTMKNTNIIDTTNAITDIVRKPCRKSGQEYRITMTDALKDAVVAHYSTM